MPPKLRRWVGIAAALALLIAVILLIRNRAPEIQAPATFERIKQAIEGNDAAGVVGELHPRYDFASEWPAYFGSDTASAVGGDTTEPRAMARRGIAVLFMQRGENHLRFTYHLAKVEPKADGTVEIDATIELAAQDGGGRLVAPAQHHWVLARDGWLLGRLRIVSHDKIDIAL